MDIVKNMLALLLSAFAVAMEVGISMHFWIKHHTYIDWRDSGRDPRPLGDHYRTDWR